MTMCLITFPQSFNCFRRGLVIPKIWYNNNNRRLWRWRKILNQVRTCQFIARDAIKPKIPLVLNLIQVNISSFLKLGFLQRASGWIRTRVMIWQPRSKRLSRGYRATPAASATLTRWRRKILKYTWTHTKSAWCSAVNTAVIRLVNVIFYITN